MEIKHILLLISIFYLLSSSVSTRSPTVLKVNLKNKNSTKAPHSDNSTPESPDSTPESPDSTPEAPDSTPESPDSTPESPDGDYEESDDAESGSVSASFRIMPGGSYPELEKICGATDTPIECVLFISPFLNDSVKIDPLVVLKAGLHAAANLSKQAIEKAEKLKKDTKTSPYIGASLDVCIENYDLIPDGTEYALKAIEKRDMDSLKTYLSGDVTSVNTCIDGYDKKKSPMKDMDSTLLNLVTANLEIATDMVKF